MKYFPYDTSDSCNKYYIYIYNYVTGFGKFGLNVANNFFQYPRVKPFGSIFLFIFYGRNG